MTLNELKDLARSKNCFIVERNGAFLVYRKMPGRNVFIGKRGNEKSLQTFIKKC